MADSIHASVILPIYNAATYLPEQLKALSNQEMEEPWELILVNNCSQDESMKIVEAFKNRFKKLIIVNAFGKQGRHYALNVGAKSSQGDKLLFTDAHAVVGANWLHRMADALSNNPFVAGGLEGDLLNQNASYRTAPFTGSQKKFMGYLPFCAGANMGIQRSLFFGVGGFCEEADYCEDAEISFRLQLKGFTIHDEPEAIVHIRYRTNLNKLFSQTTNYGFAHAYLYKKFYQFGMRRRRPKAILKSYFIILSSLLRWIRLSKNEREETVRSIAAHWGRIKGSFQFRCVYL